MACAMREWDNYVRLHRIPMDASKWRQIRDQQEEKNICIKEDRCGRYQWPYYVLTRCLRDVEEGNKLVEKYRQEAAAAKAAREAQSGASYIGALTLASALALFAHI